MRLALFPLLSLAFLSVSAQTLQQGVVKEYNEKAQKTPLAGVELNVRSASSTVSDNHGDFSLNFLTLKPGDKINVRNIEKMGYEIFNKEAVEQWILSPTVPFVIVMCRVEKFKAIRDNFEKNASKNYKRQYDKELAMLEKLKADGKIKEEEYRRKLAEVQETFDAQMDNLDNYIDRFARIDLSELSETEQEIFELLQAGNFDEAIRKYEEQNLTDKYLEGLSRKEALTTSIAKLTELEATTTDANARLLESISRQIETLMLSGTKANNDKALDLYLKIAETDTLNIDWQLRTGKHLMKYQGNPSGALPYLERALQTAERNGDDVRLLAVCYGNMGNAYLMLARHDEAERCYMKGLDIRVKNFGEDDGDVSLSYHSLGNLYENKGAYDKALEYYDKSRAISEMVWGPESAEVASDYNNIGNIHARKNDYAKALDYYSRALAIRETD